MKTSARVYVIDANILIQAHRLYYAFPICPGFWDFLLEQHQAGRIVSIDRVRAEIHDGDALHEWVKSEAPLSLFKTTEDPAVIAKFAKLVAGVQGNAEYLPAAKDEFARVADGWLVAYAQANAGHVVVTMEERADGSKKRIPLPNVCLDQGVRYMDTYTMLKELGAKFVLGS